MNIMYACDDKFVEILTVSLRSLYQHNKDASVLILGTNLSDKNKEKLRVLAEKFSTKQILFRESLDAEKLSGYQMRRDRGSIAQFARLFFEKILPTSWNKLIYLDCDTYICHSLKGLWEQQLGNSVVGGVLDAFSIYNYKALGLSADNILINSGVLLIDVCKWRGLLIEQKFISYIKLCKGNNFQGDQGIINFVLKGYICKLPLNYNVVEYIYDFSYEEILLYRKPLKYYSSNQVNEAKNNPVIVHFTTSFATVRPWEGKCNNPYNDEWIKLYNEIYKKKDGNFQVESSRIKKFTMNIMTFKCRCMCLGFVGIIHGYVRPIYNIQTRKFYLRKKY